MEESQKLHKKAMNIIDEVMYNQDPKIRSSEKRLKEAHKEAYVLERKAADLIELDPKNEPSRSVMYRSAGWMAFHAGMYDEAAECVFEGLKGCIHGEIKEELNDLLAST